MERTPFTVLVERLEHAFSLAVRKLAADLTKEEIGLTKPQFFILNLLSKRGKCTVSELADEMFVKPSAITTMIDRLYKSGFVLRERDEEDRRVVYIQLSEKGRHMLQHARAERRKIIERYLSQLQLEELEQFVHIIEKIVATNEKEEK
ncbi:DNA-binding transcriptional regulator, MarR family [Anoxybacillus pushchinoensis]|uniref:DNA-binding transcriptional regulator, MarR family n=1 Tax=Anoxybacillus pushchinoensis TaxID=150248 RepID=A0A1I0U4V7_9BACL|nr:MarR family transcriptional regulator [Anoxybacillus pushchinoensis]SFA58917.1 DNA-binding transcriptional regulator, MarR family [Anoxybacillus pushchinoensis]